MQDVQQTSGRRWASPAACPRPRPSRCEPSLPPSCGWRLARLMAGTAANVWRLVKTVTAQTLPDQALHDSGTPRPSNDSCPIREQNAGSKSATNQTVNHSTTALATAFVILDNSSRDVRSGASTPAKSGWASPKPGLSAAGSSTADRCIHSTRSAWPSSAVRLAKVGGQPVLSGSSHHQRMLIPRLAARRRHWFQEYVLDARGQLVPTATVPEVPQDPFVLTAQRDHRVGGTGRWSGRDPRYLRFENQPVPRTA